MGCATGAFAAGMAKKALIVHAFDLDDDMVNIAKNRYIMNNLEYKSGSILDINIMYKDMKFDVITCFGNTLVHLKDDEIDDTFDLVNIMLNNSGLFIFQILNYDYVFNNEITKLPIIENDVIKFDRNYILENKHEIGFITKLTIKSKNDVIKNNITLYPLFKEELNEKLISCGFNDIKYYKNYDGDAYDGNHLPLIVSAKKI